MMNELDNYKSAYETSFAYEFDNRIILNWYPERIMNSARPEHSLLELGVGHGYSAQRFSSFFSRHDVIDGSPAIIERFRATFPDSKAVLHEAYFEDFIPETKYDLIVMGFVLEHVEDPGLVLRHFRKFLKPGGRCYVAVPNGETLHRRFGHAAGLLSDYFALTPADLAQGHRRVYSMETLHAEIKAADYLVERTEGIFLKPFTTSQLLSLNLDEKITRAMCEIGVNYPELCAGLLVEASCA